MACHRHVPGIQQQYRCLKAPANSTCSNSHAQPLLRLSSVNNIPTQHDFCQAAAQRHNPPPPGHESTAPHHSASTIHGRASHKHTHKQRCHSRSSQPSQPAQKPVRMVASTSAGTLVVLHISVVQPLSTCIDSSDRRYSALVCMKATELPGPASLSSVMRSRMRGCGGRREGRGGQRRQEALAAPRHRRQAWAVSLWNGKQRLHWVACSTTRHHTRQHHQSQAVQPQPQPQPQPCPPRPLSPLRWAGCTPPGIGPPSSAASA